MYIAIFIGERDADFDKIETLGDVLKTTVDMISKEDCKWGDIGGVYENKEEFIKDIEEFMGDSMDGYVIGVDIGNDKFEIMHAGYEWVIRPYGV